MHIIKAFILLPLGVYAFVEPLRGQGFKDRENFLELAKGARGLVSLGFWGHDQVKLGGLSGKAYEGLLK